MNRLILGLTIIVAISCLSIAAYSYSFGFEYYEVTDHGDYVLEKIISEEDGGHEIVTIYTPEEYYGNS